MAKHDNPLNQYQKVWLEFCPGAAARAWFTGRCCFFGIYSYVFYVDFDGHLKPVWAFTRDLIERT